MVRRIGEQAIARMQSWEEENAKWQAEHPGEPNPAVGGAISSLNGDAASVPLIIGCSAGDAALLGVLAFVVFRILKKRRREESPE